MMCATGRSTREIHLWDEEWQPRMVKAIFGQSQDTIEIVALDAFTREGMYFGILSESTGFVLFPVCLDCRTQVRTWRHTHMQ